jgi:hypothetical protein
MISETDAKAVAAITALKVTSCTDDNEVASDALKFSTWVAGFASAAFGFLLLNTDKLADSSWMQATVASYVLMGTLAILAGSILACGFVHHLVSAVRYSDRHVTTVLNAQLARVLSGESPVGNKITVSDVVLGHYLPDESQEELRLAEKQGDEQKRLYQRVLGIQLALAGIALAALLVVGSH